MVEGLGLKGHPVRVTILNAAGERQLRLKGSIRTTPAEGWRLDLIDSAPTLAVGTPVALEVLVQGELLWTTTRLQVACTSPATTLWIEVPGALHRGQRRAYPRIDLSLPVHIQRKQGGALDAAQLRDLSAGGASFHTEADLAVGERFQMVLSLGSGLYFQNLEAEVVRRSSDPILPRTFAVRFHCDERQEALLAGWVARHLTGVPAAAEGQPERR